MLIYEHWSTCQYLCEPDVKAGIKLLIEHTCIYYKLLFWIIILLSILWVSESFPVYSPSLCLPNCHLVSGWADYGLCTSFRIHYSFTVFHSTISIVKLVNWFAISFASSSFVVAYTIGLLYGSRIYQHFNSHEFRCSMLVHHGLRVSTSFLRCSS